MENPKYILVMRQVASDYDGISHELFQIANNLERMDQFNPQQKLFSLVRNAEVSTVSLRNLTARTVRDDTAHFYGEVADLLGIRIDETHDWLKITVPAILLCDQNGALGVLAAQLGHQQHEGQPQSDRSGAGACQ